MTSIAKRNPRSPTRVVRNAFCDALRGASSWYQKPISRYEHRPMSSHVANASRRLSASTRPSIAEVKSERTA